MEAPIAEIDQAQLFDEISVFIPQSNVLTDTQIQGMISYVVDNVVPADEDIYFSQAACESLRRVGLANLTLYSVDTAGKKREKVGRVEVEYFDGTSKVVWDDYLKSLPDICSLFFGYTGFLTSNTMAITPGDRFVISPCLCVTPCDCESAQKGIYEGVWCGGTAPSDDPFNNI